MTRKNIFIACAFITGILIYLMTMIPMAIFHWMAVAPISCFASTAYVSILTQFSNQVDEQNQGWLMGITGAIMAFVWGLNGILIGIVAGLNPKYPIFIAVGSFFVTAILSLYHFRVTQK